MFLKVTTAKGRQYVSLAHAYRDNGKVKHKQLLCLGALDELKKSGQLDSLSRKLHQLCGHSADLTVNDISEAYGRYVYGDAVYRKLWEKYRYDQVLKEWSQGRRIRFPVEEAVYLQVIDRLLSPRSRLALWKQQQRYLQLNEVPLHQIYRSLDFLAEKKEALEWHTFHQHRHLFNNKVDVVFYDVTTFHFESVRTDTLREFGFSKSGKFNEVQVVMGLLLDEEGHPIGFNLFAGNTAEGKTFLPALEALKNRFQIKRLIFVADKGLNSKMNLHELAEAGYEYIVSARIKTSSALIRQKIVAREGWQSMMEGEGSSERYRYKIVEPVVHRFKNSAQQWRQYENRWIITWSEKRAGYDRQERIRMIERAEKYMEEGVSIQSKRGWKRYIKTDGETKPVGIDRHQIEKDALWDGYYGIETNATGIEETALIGHLHRLWKIEETFRIYKTTLEAEPVFVWTYKRILGHFVICFLALVLERALERKTKANGIALSAQQLRNELNSMEVSELTIKGVRYYLKLSLGKVAKQILRLFKIRQLGALTPVEELPPL